jgi:hypothetical protein
MSVIYKIKQGDQIVSAVLNSTGSPLNWSAMLDANNFTSWTPALTVGESLNIAYDSKQENIQRQLNTFPLSCNPGIPDLNEQFNELINTFANRQYIFSNGNPYLFSNGNPYILN